MDEVSGIASEVDNSLLGTGQVTFDAGVTDPIVFVKGEPWNNPRPVETVVRRMISGGFTTHTVRRESSTASSPPVMHASDLDGSALGSLYRSIPSRQLSRSSRSPSPVSSPPVGVGGRLVGASLLQSVAVDRSAVDDSIDVGYTSEGRENRSATMNTSFEGAQSSLDSPNEEQTSPEPLAGSPWALAGYVPKQQWMPAIKKPSLLSQMKDSRSRSNSRARSATPPRSNCSTPRRQRGECYHDLYADAQERLNRRKARKEAREADSENQLRVSRESSLRATRRYRSKDTRTVIERTEEHARRKAELRGVAEQNRRSKEEEELEECTFRPVLQARSSTARRAQDEREMERHLRQLAHKQLDVRARLVQLEREWARVHRERKSRFLDRVKAVQSDRKQEVFDLLNTKEGQEYYWERVQRLSESTSTKLAQSRVLHELLQDQRNIIDQQVGDEVDTELQLVGRNLDFWARRNVLLESLEAIEARAFPTIRMLEDLEEGPAILKESGFNQGLAQQMRDDVPDPNGVVCRESSAERVPGSTCADDASIAASQPARVASFQTGPARVQAPMVQVATTMGVAGDCTPCYQGVPSPREGVSRQGSSACSMSGSLLRGSVTTSGTPAMPSGSACLQPSLSGTVTPFRQVSTPVQPPMAVQAQPLVANTAALPVAALPQMWRFAGNATPMGGTAVLPVAPLHRQVGR